MAGGAWPRSWFLLVWGVGLYAGPATGEAPLFPALFVFGDSLVDVGNNNYIPALARADLAPNGIDFPTHMATGRFCNGKTVVDVLTDFVGLPYPPPYLAPTTRGAAILQGVNYASGAGGILDGTGANYVSRLSFNTQLQYFQATVIGLRSMLGPSGAADLLRDALYPIVFGSNDFINNYLLANSNTRRVYSVPQFYDLVISTYKHQLTRLYYLGARKFMVSNVGPLGCIPSRLAIGSSDGTCVPFDNEVVAGFNARLQGLLAELTATLPGAMYLYGNSYDAFYGIIKDPAPYGFTATNRGCCGLGKYKGQLPCLPVVGGLCPNRDAYVFWDPFHPTQAVNELLGRRLFLGPPADIYPINVFQLSKLQTS